MTRHPIAFFIFNRPKETKAVFEQIRQAKPLILLLVADGPRSEYQDENEKCSAVRKIVSQVDWDCHVMTHYSKTNMGCKLRVSSGLDWVFSQVEEAIILEDDCLPHPSFFEFCNLLLDKYKDDDRVFSISGTTFQPRSRQDVNSYYFSKYSYIWGWATWRRAWKFYDVNMELWEKIRDEKNLKSIIPERQVRYYWHHKFQKSYQKKVDTWDFQWIFSSFIQNGLHIIPNHNLVSNIGFGEDATHTKKITRLSKRTISEMEFPMTHPNMMLRDFKADRFTESYVYQCQLYRRIWNRIVQILSLG